MPPTIVYQCSECNGLMLTAAGQKTRTCPYCGTRVDLRKARRLASAPNAMEASLILRKLKEQRQENPKKAGPN